MIDRFRFLTRSLLFLIFIFESVVGIAWAHGGGTPRLTNAEVGPYRVSVWTQPDPLRVGTAHITVAVAEPPASGVVGEAGPPVLNASIAFKLKPMDQRGETLVVPATHEASTNKLFYEADVALPAAGQWQLFVAVSGPSGSGQTNFEIDVLPPSAFRGWVLLLGGLGLVLLAAGWVISKG